MELLSTPTIPPVLVFMIPDVLRYIFYVILCFNKNLGTLFPIANHFLPVSAHRNTLKDTIT